MPIEEIGLKTRFEIDGEEKVERALDSINKKVNTTTKHFQNLAQTLANMGRPYAQIVRITGAAAAATVQYAVNTQQAAAAVAQLTPAIRTNALVLRNQQAALNRVAAAQIATSQKRSATNVQSIKGLALLAIGTRTLFSLTMKLRREIAESIQTVFGSTEAWERYELAIEAVKRTTTAAVGEFVNLPRILEFVATKGMLAAQGISAIRFGLSELASELKRGDFAAARMTLFDPGETDRFRAEGVRITAELMEDAAEETGKFQKAIESLFGASQRFDQVLERNAASLAKVNKEFGQAQAAATGKLFARLHDIQVDFQKDVAKIDASALKSRARAFANFERQITEMQQREVDNRERLRQQNQLEREFATRRFQLSQIQSERQFQSARGFLVAEGDVLAIERLDEQHRIEQETREEDFRLQEQRTEAMFRLQLRFQEQAMRQQIAALGDALKMQLESIEENRQERIAAQKEQVAEERMEAKQAFGDQIADAKAAQIEQTNDLKTQLAERTKAMADHLAELVRQNKLAPEQVMAGWRAIYGPNAEFDQLITQAVARATRRLMQLQRGITGGRRTPFLPITFRAHGGDDVVTRPTLFMAGEAGPERIITQPLGSIGGNVSVSWKGGPIQIQGSGLEGADVSGLGNQLVEGLMISLSSEVQNARGVR